MAKTTTLNVNEINTQAQRHVDTATEIEKQLEQLKVQVDATLLASKSGATQALQTTCDNWIASVKSSVTSHLHTMATNIRNEAAGQDGTDQDATALINNLSMEVETKSFLGATNV